MGFYCTHYPDCNRPAASALAASPDQQCKKFTRGFMIVTPSLTIRDRMRVSQPNNPDSNLRSAKRGGLASRSAA